MSNREKVLKALRRQSSDFIPFMLSLCPDKLDEFKRRTGKEDYNEYYESPFRNVFINPTRITTDFAKYYRSLPRDAYPLEWNPEWGIYGEKGSTAHFQKMIHPMAEFTKVEEVNQYPFPDFKERYRWEGVAEKVNDLISKDLIAISVGMQMTLFEISWNLRGMENFMVDMMSDQEFANALLDKIADIRICMAENYAKAGVDILLLGDDVATQLNMMINPELWRMFIKPRLAKIIQRVKNIKPDILVFYHGDGNMSKIIPDIIEIGVDILNPIQPECMDPIEIKKIYGDRLSFWGTVGTQTTMPFGTPAEVKAVCRKMIDEVGKGGGLVLAPTHVIEPEVPWENIEAFVETVKNYNCKLR